ncbi:MAG: YciI family protein [Rhodanobacter sp.]
MNRYLILAMRRPHFDPAAVPLHLAFLDGLREQDRVELSGGFSDKSGGAYLLQAADLAEATVIAHSDPAHVSGGWHITVYEWQAH